MNAPRVSVVVATYKGAWLARTLRSIQEQTFREYEVLVMDDADDLATRTLVEGLNDDRFIYHGNSENLGVVLNHARGFELSRGDLISVLNHDDFWDPDVLHVLTAAIDDEEHAIAAFSSARVVGGDGVYDANLTQRAQARWGLSGLPTGFFANWFEQGNGKLGFPIGPATVMRARFVRSVPLPKIVGGAYDYWLGYRLARDGGVIHVGEGFGYWREHEDNLTHSRSLSQSLELLYIVATAAFDSRLPPKVRLNQAVQIPRRSAVVVRQFCRDLVMKFSSRA